MYSIPYSRTGRNQAMAEETFSLLESFPNADLWAAKKEFCDHQWA